MHCFGCVHADEANALTVVQKQRVAVNNSSDGSPVAAMQDWRTTYEQSRKERVTGLFGG